MAISVYNIGMEQRAKYRVKRQKMGREPYYDVPMLAMTVKLPKFMVDEIERVAGRSHRAEFIRAAIERALASAGAPSTD